MKWLVSNLMTSTGVPANSSFVAKAIVTNGFLCRQTSGEAIVGYLRRGRPPTAQGRTLFVRRRAPHQRLTSTGVTNIVREAGKRAGLDSLSAHRLRHTAATQMLRAGAPLEEIGQVLRHRSSLSTAIYAKVDRKSLQKLARPWPGGAV